MTGALEHIRNAAAQRNIAITVNAWPHLTVRVKHPVDRYAIACVILHEPITRTTKKHEETLTGTSRFDGTPVTVTGPM